MKQNKFCAICGIITLSVLIIWFLYVGIIRTVQINSQETFLLASYSPNKKYRLEAYRTEPNATVDFSVKVYLLKDTHKEMIYNAYHEYTVDITWITNEDVLINNKKLNLLLGEKYDWRMN